MRTGPLDGSSSATFLERLRDVADGVVGACTHCLPRRVRADYLAWRTITDPVLLAPFMHDEEPEAPHSERILLCLPCLIEFRSSPFDPGLYLAKIRDFTETDLW